MNFVRKTTAILAALVITVGLTACGGSSTTDTSVTSSGIVADGYLKGATVFLDKNGNKKFDAGEPTTTTGAGGAYTLTGVVAADLAAYPIVVEVTTSTVDEERGPITTPYVLSAPAGKTFISPLTTLVHTQMETSGISAVEAEQTVKTQLGLITMSPFDDYKPGTATASVEAKLVANVAKVIATTIADNKKAIEAAVVGSGGTTTVQAVVNMIVQQVMQNLPTIVQNVKSNTDSSGALSEDKVTSISGTVAVSMSNMNDLKQQLAASGSTAAAGLSDISTALTAGLYWVEQRTINSTTTYEYEKVLLTTSSGALTFNRYDLANNTWLLSTNNSSSDRYLTATGWQTDPEDTGNTFDSATGLYSSPKGFQKMIVRAVKIDVSGQRILPYLNNAFYSPSVVDAATFPAGSEAYQLTMVPQVDIYRLDGGSGSTNYSTLDAMLAGASSSNGNYWYYDNYTLRFGALGSDNTGALEIKSGSNTLSSTYKRVTVNNIDMVIADTASASRYSDSRFVLFAVYNGSVRSGKARLKNVAMIDNSYNFNKTAISAIMSAAVLPVIVQ